MTQPNLHAALLDECRRLGEIASDELAGAVAALRVVADACENTSPCSVCGDNHSEIKAGPLLRAVAAELGIGANHA